MPNYTFQCQSCGRTAVQHRPFSTGPVAEGACDCGGELSHDFCIDVLSQQVNTAGCRDHNFIPEERRVASNDGFGIGKAAAARKAAGYGRAVAERRKALRDGGNKGSIRQTMSVPAELFHGKIRETGDKNYWNDKGNVSRHKEWQVG